MDALAAYSLYRAVMAAHPSPWRLADWQRTLATGTPFPLLRRAILDDLLEGHCQVV